MPRPSPPTRTKPALLAALITVLGLVISAFVAHRVHTSETVRVEAHRDAAARQAAELIETEVTRAVDVLRGAAAVHGTVPGLDQPTFAAWGVRAAEAGSHPGLRNVNILSWVADEDVERWVAERNAEPGPQVRPAPVAGQRVHCFVRYTSGDESVLGLDLAGNPTRTDAMHAAIDTGVATISESFVLAIDANLPVEQQRPAFSVYVPLYEGGVTPPTVEQRRERIVGFASAAFRVSDLLDGITPRLAPDTNVLWYGDLDGGAESLLASSSPGLVDHQDDHAVTPMLVDVVGKTWRIDVLSHATTSMSGVWLLLAGGALSFAVGVLVLWLGITRARLHHAHTEASGLLIATLDAVGAGVVTCDVDGRLTHVNDEARRIHGIGLTDAGPHEWAAQYRIHTRDGRVATLDELPLWRALRGESVSDQELVIHPPGEPLRVVATSARPVVSHGRKLVGAVVAMHDVTDRVHARDELARQATTDALTGLGNRRAAFDDLHERLTHDRKPVSVLFVDLDGFKPVNDRYGHDAGDDVLRAIGMRIGSTLRAGDRAYRLGGDEFLVMLDGDEAASTAFAERLRRALEAPVAIIGATVDVTASIGCATSRPGETADALVRRADQAMLERKRERAGVRR